MKTNASANYRELRPSTLRRQGFFAGLSLFVITALFLLPLFSFITTVRAAGVISGVVFQDFNSNGNFDTGITLGNEGDAATVPTTISAAVDQRVGGVTVTVYNAAGAQGSAVTCTALNTPTAFCTGNNNGAYSIDTATSTGPYRVEFTNLPANYKPSGRNSDSVSGGAATESGSTVQFVANAATANVNLALNVPEDYCQNNPEIASCNYSFGDQTDVTATGSGNTTALLSFPYSAGSSDQAGNAAPAKFDVPARGSSPYLNLTANSLGTTYGLAYARSTGRLYAGAFFKRHSGFGRGANGTLNDTDDAAAVYVIDTAGQGSIVPGATFTVPGITLNRHNPANYQTDNDDAGWNAVGTSALGGMAISDDDRRLYVMNLENRTLYARDLSTGAFTSQAVPTANLPTANGTCDARDVRPFAVTYYRNEVHVGMVCSGENSTNVDSFTDVAGFGTAGVYDAEPYMDSNNNGVFDAGEPYQEIAVAGYTADTLVDGDGNGVYNVGDARKLTAYVYKVNPTTLQFGASPAFSTRLDYKRGTSQASVGGQAHWKPWSPAYANANVSASLTRTVYAQPMLTGITFDRGNLVLGLRDRLGDQVGHQTQSRPNSTDQMQPRTNGDTLRACVNGSGWTLEANAVCGGSIGAQQNSAQGPPNAARTASGEFYSGDAYTLTGAHNTNGVSVLGKGSNHDEVSLGGVAQMPGAPDVIATIFDPIPNVGNETHDGGVRWLSNSNGGFTKGYRIYDGATGSVGTLGKSNGIGDLEMLCDSAPIEVGNRVWIDSDNDGVQDPQNGTETGRANVTVELYTGDLNNDGDITDPNENVLVGTVNTDANGEWYFNNTNVADGDPTTAGAQPGLKINTNYIARIGAADFTNHAGTGDLAGFKAARSNAPVLFGTETTAANNVDSRDSDAVVADGRAEIRFNSSTAGSNNHALDFGFVATAANNVSIGSHVFLDRNNNGVHNPNGVDGTAGNADDEVGINDVTVDLYFDANGNGTIDAGAESTPIASVKTFNNGNYYFDNLAPGNYQVRIPASSFTEALLNAQTSSTNIGTSATDNATDGDDNGTQAVVRGETVSPIIALTNNGESTAETFAGGAQDGLDDDNGNMTVDFGFVPNVYSLGNRVWFDTNNDGIINPVNGAVPAESGIAGVTLTLLNADDTVYDSDLSTAGIQALNVTTSATGHYRFDNLRAGAYKVLINASNFADSGSNIALRGYRNTTGSNAADQDAATTLTTAGENGVDPASYVGSNAASPRNAGIVSNVVTLGGGASEPISEADQGGAGDTAANGTTRDLYADLTVDFGFYRMNLSGTVFNDGNNDALLNGTDVGVNGVVVRLYNADGTEVPVGPDGILGTADDTTGASNRVVTGVGVGAGEYNFGGLPAGDYFVRITKPSTSTQSSLNAAAAPDPDNNTDSDDNGAPDTTAGFTNTFIGLPITLTPGGEVSPATTQATGTTSNPTYDFGLVGASTAVELQSFDALTFNNGVLLEWKTGGEVNNIGFRIWRSRGGKRELVNKQLIAGSAFIGGVETPTLAASNYRWFDEQGTSDSVYYLEDVDANGAASEMRAAAMRTGEGGDAPRVESARLLNKIGGETATDGEKPLFDINQQQSKANVEKAVGANFASGAAIKLAVKTDGWQRVEYGALIAAGLPADANPATWQLFSGKSEKALRVNNDGSVEFYGTALDTTESDARVYWFVWNRGAGKRITAVDASGVDEAQVSSFVSVVETHQNSLYVPAVRNGERDNFFGAVVSSESNNQIVNLKNVAAKTGGAFVELDVQGFTPGAHRVEVRFNRQIIGFAELNGMEFKNFRFALDSEIVRDGANEVQLTGQSGESISLVDGLRVGYARQTSAVDGKLTFVTAPGAATLVDNFASPKVRVFDVTDDREVTELQLKAEATDNGFAVKLPAQTTARLLVAFDDSVAGVNPQVAANAPSDWRGFKKGANFVIISHREFRAAAEKLAAARTAEGLSTIVVDVEDLYDEYANGAHTGAAIREFLNSAKRWETRPQYLLLFGDANADARNYLSGGNADFVPTKFVETARMEAASDDALTDFDNDGTADIATGRIPVRTRAQADQVIAKLLEFERAPVRQNANNGALLVADTEFEAETNSYSAILLPQMRVEQVNRRDHETVVARAKILGGINSGAKIVGFVGHGTNAMWASNQLFHSDDAANLTNSTQLSLFVNLTCHNGSFADPRTDSLSESLLTAQRGGAYAVWASSGMTTADAQLPMGAAVFNSYGRDRNQRLGDILRNAKQAADSLDVRRTWTLIGDPTARMR